MQCCKEGNRCSVARKATDAVLQGRQQMQCCKEGNRCSVARKATDAVLQGRQQRQCGKKGNSSSAAQIATVCSTECREIRLRWIHRTEPRFITKTTLIKQI